MYKVLSIAGSSSMGGAGVQADLKTFQECGVFGMGAITAFVTVSPKHGRRIYPQPLDVVEAQCEAALADSGVDSLKTGMLHSVEHIQYAADLVKKHELQQVVVDPVMVTKSGAELLQQKAVKAMQETLFPLARVITPNIPEAIKLSGMTQIDSVAQMQKAAQKIYAHGSEYVLVKGGSLKSNEAIDLLYDGESFTTFTCERIDTNTNGAGCSFSAAIAAELAKGTPVPEAVKTAKAYITAAIRHALRFADGRERINHAALREILEKESVEVTVL